MFPGPKIAPRPADSTDTLPEMFRSVFAGLGVIVWLLVACASASATALGVQDDQLTWRPPGEVEPRVELLAATGARWTRVDVHWREIAPAKPARPSDPADPAYRWEQLDTVMRSLDARGIRAILTAFYSPSWANGGRDHRWVPDRIQYAAFMVALGRRYSGTFIPPDAVSPLPKVTHFELWNEPNLAFFFTPQWRKVRGRWHPVSPALYGNLVKAVTPRLRRARPDALVIVGALGPTNTTNPPSTVGVGDFIAALRRQKVPAMAASQHLYPGAPPGRSGALPSDNGLPRIIKLWGGIRPGIPVYVTETGYTTSPSGYHGYHVDEQTQAIYLRQLVRNLARPRVPLIVWYQTQDHTQWTSGLTAIDGRRKPAFDAFREMVAELQK